MTQKVKLSKPAIVFVIFGALILFGLNFLWGTYMHFPSLDKFCRSTCSDLGYQKEEVRPGYVATSTVEGCSCKKADNSEVRAYFVFQNQFLDWLFLVFFRLIPIAVICAVSIFIIAKIVVKI